jgi:hypothetical protein
MRLDVETLRYAKQRRYARTPAPASLVVAWQAGGRRSSSRVRDLSLGGTYIWHTDPPDPGTALQLLFDAPDGEVRVSAQVRYVQPRGGMGVEFVGMDFAARRRLSLMLQRMTA